MRKSTVTFMTCAIASTIAVAGLGITAYADGNFVNEEEISITAALDQYLANQPAVTDNTQADTTQPATEAAVQPTEEVVAETTQAPVSTAQYPEFEGKALANVSGNLNIRSGAAEDAERIGKLPAGAVATVLGAEGDWTQIKSGSVTGYVKSEYLVFGDEAGVYAEQNLPKMAVVQTTTLKVREEKSTESTCVTMIPGGEEYVILEQSDGWTQIEIDDATTGYVSDEYIDVTYSLATAVSIEEELMDEEDDEEEQEDTSANNDKKDSSSNDKKDSSSNDKKKSSSEKKTASSDKKDSEKPSDTKAKGTRKEVVNYALQFVGNPYVYGGSSLTKGTDCSGFTMSVYKHFGISLPHNSASQSKCGTKISVSDVQPGDLLFYGNGSGISHVALYIGNGQIVHASSRKTGIKISKYNYKTPKCAVSILD